MVDWAWTTRRFASVLPGVTLMLAISGCTGASPSATASSGVSSPTATPDETSSPSSTPQELGAGSWTSVEGMIEVGSGYTATLLRDGRVLMAGGVSSGADWAAAQLYDPADGSWTATGSLNHGRASHTAALLPNGSVLVAGGYGLNDSPTSAEVYDPQTGRWTAAGNMIEARWSHTATLLLDGTVLVAGGGLASAELYDPVTKTWTATGSMAEARLSHTATLLPDGRVLVVGGEISCGFECHSPLVSADLYDPVARTWTPTQTMTQARFLHTATLLPDDTVLVAGGCCGIGYLEPRASAELFDSNTGLWTAAPGMTEAGLPQTATLLHDGRVLVAGKEGAAAELYDPTMATWSATATMAGSRGGETATMLADGRVLLVAASSGGGATSAQLYDPDGGS